MTVMQRLLRDPTSGCNPRGEAPAPRSFNPMYYYWSVTKQLGAVTGVTRTEPTKPKVSTTSQHDEEDTPEEWAARGNAQCPVGGGTRAAEYIAHSMATTNANKGALQQGYSRIMVGNVVAYTNGQPKQGSDWYSDGSMLTVEGHTPENRAGAALKCGPLKSILRVQGPQTSYRAELQGAVIFVELADPGDSLALDNQAVVEYGPV